MLKESVIVLCIGIAAANICNDGTGTWAFSLVDGVTDFAYGGVQLNNKYNCFEGCLNTQTAVQDFKVALNGTVPPTASMPMVKQRKLGPRANRLARVKKMQESDEDPNEETCADPQLRTDVANAINKVTDHSCKGIVKALLFNLNRPGWAVNCVDFNELALGSYLRDYNFCEYEAVVGQDLYWIRMAKIDTSN
ncbi:hypothetical protein V3C99_015894 [Haemonchus contortus]